jgi:class 3 adenylate cyclase/predicted alpha/beta hydrolase
VDRPETHYAKSDGVSIAYQVSGSGPIDVVSAPGTVSHLDLEIDWDSDFDRWYLERFHAFSRLIRFDKRGTGMSDRVTDAATLEQRTDDIRAVMDAVGSERAVIFGASEGGSMACLFAATYPARTRALIVWGGQARWVREPDMPWGMPREEYDGLIDDLAAHGVTERYVRGWGFGVGDAASSGEVDELIRYVRAGASPASMAALERMNMQIDLRDVLPAISVPTLIINASDDPVSPIEGARYLAGRIPGARLFEYAGATHFPSERQDWSRVLDEIEGFVTGTRPLPPVDRVLSTVLFTDIVGSTERAARFGDAAWTDLLAKHDDLARKAIELHRGRFVDAAGDGIFATFDGPARAVRCAQSMGGAMAELGLQIRAGCHTGEVELSGDQVRGIAVHIGARVAALAGPSEILVSSTVKDLVVGSGLAFEDAGEHELKGLPDRWRLYRVVR